MAACDRIDAAVRAGEPDLARRWVGELTEFADATGRPWALAAVAYGRAMTDDDLGDPAASGDSNADGATDQTEQLFVDALQSPRGRWPRLRPRSDSSGVGEWLRRSQRRVDAREHLRRALETFNDLHAAPLAERSTAELRASGETARKRDVSTLVKLTPMELKVAQLVASGMSNKDVAAQIWVSPRTVAFHLRNVFAKAGVTSRGELAQLDLS